MRKIAPRRPLRIGTTDNSTGNSPRDSVRATTSIRRFKIWLSPDSQVSLESPSMSLVKGGRDHDLGKASTQGRFARQVEQFFGLRVPVDNAVLVIDGDDRIQGGVQDRSIRLQGQLEFARALAQFRGAQGHAAAAR